MSYVEDIRLLTNPSGSIFEFGVCEKVGRPVGFNERVDEVDNEEIIDYALERNPELYGEEGLTLTADVKAVNTPYEHAVLHFCRETR